MKILKIFVDLGWGRWTKDKLQKIDRGTESEEVDKLRKINTEEISKKYGEL